ncbi:hypothetical protein ACFVUY_37095 [Kitasatospora sp. NPDC058063]|uniref:hypothetical protein n=1 Tax=unclassified Kitasatospora TaxID=2633591 RepID=UPI0036DD5FE6
MDQDRGGLVLAEGAGGGEGEQDRRGDGLQPLQGGAVVGDVHWLGRMVAVLARKDAVVRGESLDGVLGGGDQVIEVALHHEPPGVCLVTDQVPDVGADAVDVAAYGMVDGVFQQVPGHEFAQQLQSSAGGRRGGGGHGEVVEIGRGNQCGVPEQARFGFG